MSVADINFGCLFQNHVDGERVAAIDIALPGEPRQVTCRALVDVCDSIADGLLAADLGPGDRTGLPALNRHEHVAVMFAALRVGCGGEYNYPSEVEFLCEGHTEIVQAAVVPFEDERKGQCPSAFVVRREGASLNVIWVKQYALENGPAYAHPRESFPAGDTLERHR